MFLSQLRYRTLRFDIWWLEKKEVCLFKRVSVECRIVHVNFRSHGKIQAKLSERLIQIRKKDHGFVP